MKRFLLLITAVLLFFTLLYFPTQSGVLTKAQTKALFIKAIKAQQHFYNERETTKNEIYRKLSPYFEKEIVSKWIEKNFYTKEKNGKIYYYLLPIEIFPPGLYMNEFGWDEHTKVSYHKKKPYEYIKIEEQIIGTELNDSYTSYVSFRKKIGTKNYKIFYVNKLPK